MERRCLFLLVASTIEEWCLLFEWLQVEELLPRDQLCSGDLHEVNSYERETPPPPQATVPVLQSAAFAVCATNGIGIINASCEAAADTNWARRDLQACRRLCRPWRYW
jgi:hypothetical protein